MTIDETLDECLEMAKKLLAEYERVQVLFDQSQELLKQYEALVDKLQRENGKLRLLADLKADIVRLQ